MGVRLYSEFRTDRGDQYKIEIHDSQFVASPTTFNVDSRGFDLSYEGQTDDIVSPVVASKLTFGAYSTDNTFEAFLNTLKTFQENRFRVVVYRISSQDIVSDFETRVLADGGTIESSSCVTNAVNALGLDSYQLFWVGWITQDLVNVEDASRPYIYEITATDGIGRLANIDYDDANTIVELNGFRTTRVTEFLLIALSKIGTADLWGGSEPFVETAVDWWETNGQTYSTSVDPLSNQGFDVRYFTQKDDDGNDVYSTALDIITQLATLYSARVYMQRGRFVFEQYGNRSTAARYVSRYTKTGTHLGRVLVSDDIAVDQTLFAARRAGNNWDFLPAAQSARIHYEQRFLNPFNAFGNFRFGTIATNYVAGFIAGGGGVQLGVGSNEFYFRSQNLPTLTAPAFPVFKMRIRIQDASTGTYYYYNRAFLGATTANASMFATPAWSTTPGHYFFDLQNLFAWPVAVVRSSVQIITDDIPVSGEMDFVLEFHGLFSTFGPQVTLPVAPTFGGVWTFGIVTNGASNAPGATFTSNNNATGVDSNITIDLGDVVIADGPRQTGHLAVFNGSAWSATSAWRKGSTGTSLPILKLLTNETMALHVRPIEQYNGNVISTGQFGQRLTFESSAYLMTRGMFTANTDEWSGTWYKIQRIREDVVALDPVDDLVDRTPIGVATTSGVSPNDIVGGRIGGMIIDISETKIGPYQQTTDGARITADVEVVGAAKIERSAIIGLESFVDSFAARVAADGGTIESAACVSNAITALTSGELVSLIPTALSSTLKVTDDVSFDKKLSAGDTTLSTLDAGVSTLASAQITGDTTIGGAATIGDTLAVVGKTSTSYVQLDTAFEPNGELPGAVFWNQDTGTAAVVMGDGNFLDIGEKNVWFAKNQTGAAIPKGAAVAAVGTLGSSGKILIAPMIANGSVNAKYFLGITNAAIANGGDGYVTAVGKVRKLNTSGFSAGAVLYVSSSTAGALTATEPAAPNLKLPIAFVVNVSSNNGTLAVRQTEGTYLSESHDVQIDSPQTNELLARTSSGRWENVTLGSVLETSDAPPAESDQGSVDRVYGSNGTLLGEPEKWIQITIGTTNYLIPAYLAP